MQHLLGKYVIIGITFLDADENIIRQFQTHGQIVSADSYNGIIIDKADGSGPFGLPPQPESFHIARPGDYRLRWTDEVVTDPDYTASWTMRDTRPEYVQTYVERGLVGPFHGREH